MCVLSSVHTERELNTFYNRKYVPPEGEFYEGCLQDVLDDDQMCKVRAGIVYKKIKTN